MSMKKSPFWVPCDSVPGERFRSLEDNLEKEGLDGWV